MGALAGAECDETAGQTGRAAVGLGVAEAVGVAHQQRMVAPVADLFAQDVGDGQRRHLACSTAPLKKRRTAPRSALPDGVLGIWSTIAMSVGIS